MNKIDIIFILLTVHHLFYISSLDISNIVFLFMQCRYDFYSSFHLVPQQRFIRLVMLSNSKSSIQSIACTAKASIEHNINLSYYLNS